MKNRPLNRKGDSGSVGVNMTVVGVCTMEEQSTNIGLFKYVR